ncbi:MAG: xanthine dehydrogenase family protein subunit M [Caldisericia bacterium]|jgi:CO/xanthine dehydrogenase FAD-binding subunit|nr:xanthine dehydrogenase family protein subunit M [Caldisericia bacterium]
MKEFEYFKPKNLLEALDLAKNFGNNKRFLAGGTDLIVRLKDNLIKEENIIDLKDIDELKGIKENGDEIEIGPLVTFTEIIESEIMNKYSPLIVLAAKKVGSPQIRNKGTIGGNLCNASPAGDSIPPLMCEEARLLLKSKDRERVVNINEFFLGPGKTCLNQDEILVKIVVKKWKNSNLGFFNKLGQRNALTISIASNCVKIDKEGKNIKDIKISLGSVAPTVVRAKKVEEAILNLKEINEDELFKISSLIENEIDPITDVRGSREYRIEVSKYLLYESLIYLFNL